MPSPPAPVSFGHALKYWLKLGSISWPSGIHGGFEGFSALVGIAAFVALFRYQIGIMPVIGACAAAGLAHRLFL